MRPGEVASVSRQESFQLRLARLLPEQTNHRLDVYLFVPGELGLTSQVLAEEAFYHAAIQVKRTYYSDRDRLPLMLSRLAERGRLAPEQYRLSLSLHAYQYVVAMERLEQPLLEAVRATHQVEKGTHRPPGGERPAGASGPEASPAAETPVEQRLCEHADLALEVLEQLRRQEPTEESLHRYYATIDNYLSWFTEQRLLALMAALPRGARFRETRERLLAICRAEEAHRESREYNSRRVTRDPTRMSNKMRLLRRLIEYPVTLKSHTQELGSAEQKAVKALATAVVMVFVTLGLLKARDTLADVTALFVLAMAVLYALREVFKDDLRNTLWRLLRKGRPKWRRRYRDPTRDHTVSRQLEWFDYKRFSRLDAEIQRVRKRNVAQREELVLHYRSRSRMSPTRFLSGYNRIRETLTLDLSSIAALMDKGHHEVYRLEEGAEVVREEVEKRYLLNLVVCETPGEGPPTLQRWKVVMKRSRIVDLEQVHMEGPELEAK